MTDTTTANRAQEKAHDAAEEGRAVASTAMEQARDVAEVAREQAASVTTQAVDQARTVVGGATDEVREQLEQRLHDLAGATRETAEQLQALCEGRPEEAGRARDLAEQASRHLGRMADRVEDLGVQGVVEEVGDFARRRPVVFLAGAAAAGMVVGHLAKASRSTAQGPSSPNAPGAGEGSGATTVPPPPAAPLPPPAMPGTDPGGPSSGWAGDR